MVPVVITGLCAMAFAALGCFRLVEEWKMSASDGVILFAQMMAGPFSRAFLHPDGGLWSVVSSPVLMAIIVGCLFSFILPAIRKKKSSIYLAAAGAAVWITSGSLIIIAAGM